MANHDLETLHLIYQREQPNRPHWPSDWPTAQGMPLIMALLRTIALHPSAARSTPQTRLKRARPRQMTLQAAPTFDGKRAAANDKDD